MTILNEPLGGTGGSAPTVTREDTSRERKPGATIIKWLTTTDHKTIGTLYLTTSFAFFLVGGVLALIMRAELARPGLQILTQEQYDQVRPPPSGGRGGAGDAARRRLRRRRLPPVGEQE